ncbi:MAG: Protein of unknown function (DUF1553)/Protein of unknown function (DUF1549)/Planctomycete [Planctomycetota bacterium]|nr:Protein of unknown function (DUF1553)/Protein of unknown function (DUF1549)/Planctomycete [Planctomycetota bacterium]
MMCPLPLSWMVRPAFAVAVTMIAVTSARGQSPAIDFGKDVRPILEANCLSCHGPEKQKSGLRLDRKADAMKGGDTGVAIVPNKSGESDLIARVASEKADFRMPPKGERLSAAQVDTLKKWIDGGAVWAEDGTRAAKNPRDHWAFNAPVRPVEPKTNDAAWARNPIDRFVLAKLEKEGLKPSPEADMATLLRRASLDLIGLPPSPEEIDKFLNDKSPDAYEKAVDRLLQSPHYGERWAQHWLDAARYADSDGYEKDKPRYIWFYRDWVINSFNKDLPYNQFLIDQLAGDLLPNATQDQIVATGFLRNSLINEEGGIDPEQFRMEAMFDRMDAIGKSMLGLTIQCAQCHNHKFDPISQEEYYKFFAFLNNDDEPSAIVYSGDEQMKIATMHRRIKEVEADLKHKTPDWPEKMARWEQTVQGSPEWKTVTGSFIEDSTGGQKYKLQPDGSYVACGYAPTKHTGILPVKTELTKIAAFRIELLNDANLPGYGPGRSFKGTCALTEFAVEAAPADEPGKKQAVKFVKASADFEQPEAALEPNFDDKSGKKRITGSAAFAIDGKDETAWGIDAGPGRRNVEREAIFVPEKPLEFPKGAALTFQIKQNHGGWNSDDLMTNNLGRFRLSVASTAPEISSLPKRVRDILPIAADKRTPAQVAAVFSYWGTTVPEWKAANDEIEGAWRDHPQGTTTLVLKARATPRVTSILKRGDFLKPVRPVTVGTPAFLHPLNAEAAEEPSRLALAKWIAAPESPTTARVFVNRMWQTYFGTGLVATPEDFGMRCDDPSHPELLDWLATEFMARGWSIKAIHRAIVTSATYRQQGKVTPELQARDPYNRLLARGPRLRVEAEVVRDIQLSASGLLNEKVGGKSIMPPAPEYLFQPPASYAPFPWKAETGTDRYRRSVYIWRRRSTPFPMLTTFDAPDASTSCVRRSRSNTPLQALVTLNETTSMEAARAMARRVLIHGGTTDLDRLAYGFRLCTGRVPTGAETDVLRDLLEKQRRRFADGLANPWEIATGSNTKPGDLPKGSTPTQLAAYTLVSRVLLNLDETITKE